MAGIIKGLISEATGGIFGNGKAPTDTQSGSDEAVVNPDISSGYVDAHPLAQQVAQGDTGFWSGQGQANTPANNSLAGSNDLGSALSNILGQTKIGQGINFAKKAYNTINPSANDGTYATSED
jgi:hypothetical protein